LKDCGEIQRTSVRDHRCRRQLRLRAPRRELIAAIRSAQPLSDAIIPSRKQKHMHAQRASLGKSMQPDN